MQPCDQVVPRLSKQCDIVQVSDPFFGKLDGAAYLCVWAANYLEALHTYYKQDRPVVLLGYSFGGLLVLEMARSLEISEKGSLFAKIVVDTRSYDPDQPFSKDEEERQTAADDAVRLFGPGQRKLIEEYFDKHALTFCTPGSLPRPFTLPSHPGGRGVGYCRLVAESVSTY